MSNIHPAVSPDQPITIKIALSNSENRRFKLALKELGANTLPDKVRLTINRLVKSLNLAISILIHGNMTYTRRQTWPY